MQDNTGSSVTAAAVLLTYTRERQLVYGTPVQLLHAQAEAVACKPTLARPSARNSHYGIGGGRVGGVSHRQELSTSSSYLCCCEPECDPAQLESRPDALN